MTAAEIARAEIARAETVRKIHREYRAAWDAMRIADTPEAAERAFEAMDAARKKLGFKVVNPW